MTTKTCPFFNCTNVRKFGLQNGRQRYYCNDCKRSWSSIARPVRRLQKLWKQYASDGRTVKSLAEEYKKSPGYIRSQLGLYVPKPIIQKPRIVAVIMDVTYFGDWGILVVIDPYAAADLKENTVLYYALVDGTEKTRDYPVATDTIEYLGYSIIMATIDGRRGVKTMLESKGILVQYCQFHQLMTITQCLTKRPRLIQNIELRAISQTLTNTTESLLKDNLTSWYMKHSDWLKERDPITKRWSHMRTRRAYFSLCRNLPNLFTQQLEYMTKYSLKYSKKLANTTSPLDGRFGVWKDKLVPHRGASKQLKVTMLRSFFSGGTD